MIKTTTSAWLSGRESPQRHSISLLPLRYNLEKLSTFGLLTYLQSAQNHTSSRLLQLPAEIRLQIYSYCIYPKLYRIQIMHSFTLWHPEETTFSPSIFHASRQLRAEALSYLCAEKALQIYGVDTANAFFETIGSHAIGDVRNLSIAQVLVHNKPLRPTQIDHLFHFLRRATSLQYFRLEIGILEHESGLNSNTAYMVLFEKTLEFIKERDGLQFRWTAGVSDPQLCRLPRFEPSIVRIRDVLGADFEDPSMPTMYLW
jgi:hypothetical protein